MKIFDIEQFIYTKLNKEDSPFKKKDFHTAFYPLHLLNKTDIMLFENRIFVPDIENFQKKQIIYFREIKGENCLIIQQLKMLPDERDEFGRAGIFIVHGFIFPKKVWEQVTSPHFLFQLVEKYTFNSRADILQSSLLNKENGDAKAIQISEEELFSIPNPFMQLESEFSKLVLRYLINCFENQNNGIRIIVRCTEDEAYTLFNTLMCYLPVDLRERMAWDTSLDGGRMMDSSFPLAAYEIKVPRGGDHILFNMKNGILTPHPKFKIPEINIPWHAWLYHCIKDIESSQQVTDAKNMSDALSRKDPIFVPEINWNIRSFCLVNEKIIEKRFRKKVKMEFSGRIRKTLKNQMLVEEKMFYFLGHTEKAKLHTYIESAIFTRTLTPKKISKPIPANYLQKTIFLQLFNQLWQTNQFDIELFNKLVDTEKYKFADYLLKARYSRTAWFTQLIQNDFTLRKFFTRIYEKPQRIVIQFVKYFDFTKEQLKQLGFDTYLLEKMWILKYKWYRKLRGC